MLAQVDPCLVLLRLQALANVAEADDVLLHQAEDRRMQSRVGQPLDAIDVVLGGQFPAVAPGEITEDIDGGKLRRAKGVIGVIAALAAGKSRMRLIAYARLDRDHIVGEGDLRRIGIVRKDAPLAVQIARLRHRVGCRGDQRIGPLQVVILQRRLVDLGREGDFVLAVGLHRVEMFRPVGERAVKDVPAPIRRRIRVVPCAAAGRQQQRI